MVLGGGLKGAGDTRWLLVATGVGMASIGDPMAAPIFVKRLKSKDRRIRRAAVTGLAKTGDHTHRAVLFNAYQRERESFVKRELRKALESPRIGLKWDATKRQFIDPQTDKSYQAPKFVKKN